jgi:hypothetical protein
LSGCEHPFVSLSALHFALREKDADRCLEIAAGMEHVPLRYALRLTLLLADVKHPRYEAAARRLVARVLIELAPPMNEVKKLADALAHVHHYYYGTPARLALQDVVGQLHRRERSVEVNFDSLA